jgi:hypothetical protein
VADVAELQRLRAKVEEARRVNDQLNGVVIDLRAESDRFKLEVVRLRRVINFDRTELAKGLGDVLNRIQSYNWIREGHWGSLEYDERTVETLRREFTDCLNLIESIAERSLRDSGDRVDSAFNDGPQVSPDFNLEPTS